MPYRPAFGLAASIALRPALRNVLAHSPLQRSFTPTASAAPVRRMPAISRALVPSRELQAFVPDAAQPRASVLKHLSAYVKKNKLQDPDAKTMVLCDAPLRALFGVDTCSFLAMSKYVSPHLRKPEEVGGKYVDEAAAIEEAWVAENGHKPVVRRQKKSSTTAAAKSSKSLDEARANGTGLWKPVRLSADLQKVCGKAEMPRQEIIKAVWLYIRSNKLQSKPGSPIVCDSAMKKVFNCGEVSARQIMSGIGPHVTKT